MMNVAFVTVLVLAVVQMIVNGYQMMSVVYVMVMEVLVILDISNLKFRQHTSLTLQH
jgi:hypothetical protein